MNRIEEAIYQVHYMDNQGTQDGLLNRIHPFVKLCLTMCYLILLTSISKYDLMTILEMGVFLGVLCIAGELSLAKCLHSLRYLVGILALVGIANPILDRRVITYIGRLPVTMGMLSMTTLLLKGVFALLMSYILICTTSMEQICCGLRKLHLPSILITVILLIYRYIMVFLKEAGRMWTAYSMRAPNQKGLHVKVWGSMIGSLMLRSIDKADIVYQSMELRGFDPDQTFVMQQPVDLRSWCMLAFGMAGILVLRFVPVFQLVGQIFVS